MIDWTCCEWFRFFIGLSPAIAAFLLTLGATVEHVRKESA